MTRTYIFIEGEKQSSIPFYENAAVPKQAITIWLTLQLLFKIRVVQSLQIDFFNREVFGPDPALAPLPAKG